MSSVLFDEKDRFSASEIIDAFQNDPRLTRMSLNEMDNNSGIPILDLIVKSGATSSKSKCET